jgi:hypothetical protein
MRTRLSAFLSVVALACITSAAGAQAKAAGTVCMDGTTSTATGKGACSSHGGVKKADAAKTDKAADTKVAKPAPPKPAKTADTTKAKATTAGGAKKTAMVKCTDGTMSKGGQGACSSHGGIAKPK